MQHIKQVEQFATCSCSIVGFTHFLLCFLCRCTSNIVVGLQKHVQTNRISNVALLLFRSFDTAAFNLQCLTQPSVSVLLCDEQVTV